MSAPFIGMRASKGFLVARGEEIESGSQEQHTIGMRQRKELLVSGRLAVDDSFHGMVGRIFKPTGFRVGRRLVNAATGYPLVEMNVKMCVALPREAVAGGRAETQEYVLGRGVSGAEGHFSITLADTPFVRQQLCMLRQCKGSYYLKAEWAEVSYYTSAPLQGATPARLTIEVPLPAVEVQQESWAAMAKRLEEARMVQLHAMIAELVSKPSTDSLFGDWDLALRQSAATELEQAFADPDRVLRGLGPLPTFHALRLPGAFETYTKSLSGKAGDPAVAKALSGLRAKTGSFHDLLDVDWVIDTAELGIGQLGKATNKYQDQYIDSTLYGDAPGPVLQAGPPSPLERYRDYLRAIYTGPAGPGQSFTQYRQKLEHRFHQNFAVTSIAEQPVNQILIPIFRAILTASPVVGYGFGMSAASLPVQGQKPHRQYLDELIALTNLSARELGLRFRIDLERADSVLSSAVAENIATLQGFYRDGFQCGPEPAQSALFDGYLLGNAPFYLQYDEWLNLTKPSFPENYHQITATFTSGVVPEAREHVEYHTTHTNRVDAQDEAKWVFALTGIETEMNDGHKAFGLAQYAIAMDHYETALALAYEALQFYAEKDWYVPSYNADYAISEPYIGPYDTEDFAHVDNFRGWSSDNLPKLFLGLVHLMAYVIPVCKGDACLAVGDYPGAAAHYASTTRFVIATVDEQNALSAGAYFGNKALHETSGGSMLHLDGNLPYTAGLPVYRAGKHRQTSLADHRDMMKFFYDEIPDFAEIAEKMPTSMERKFLKLRHGNALLEWADALYRTDEPAGIARARELYKAVLFLHGTTPPIRPQWPNGVPLTFVQHSPNPAVVSQTKRARQGFRQIELRLNYYGVNDDFVPVLRYRPLKDAADRLAANAKSAQQDFLTYLGRVEDAMREGMVTANMLKKATLQSKIADEQVKVAEFNVMVAEQQVAQVEAAIDAKQQEMADYGGWEILGDLVSGMTDSVTEFTKDKDVKKAWASNSAASGSAATSSLGVTTGVMGAVGMVIYAGVVSCVAIQDGMDQRSAELHALQEVALPMAKANLKARQSELTIAQLQKEIAVADAELAAALIKFQANRTLNIEFWNSVATVVKRAMRRYLELGARFAWLAERALQYEQDRNFNIVRFDYFPRRLQGVTGADVLQLDLAELEAARLDGIKGMMPIKHTYSMMTDFPLQFVQLKQEGRCSFRTTELPFRHAYPGTYGYRVIGVSVGVKGIAGGIPVRGLLRNRGISLVSRDNGESHVSVRFPDAFPLSEFQQRADMVLYRLPDEALMSFEGSGVESFWELSFPTLANPYGLDGVADIELTFDVRASYSPSLYDKHIETAPTSVKRFLFFSALKHSESSLATLQDTTPGAPNTVAVPFHVGQIGLPLHETNRAVTNLLVSLAAETPLTLPATFGPQGVNPVTVTFSQNMVLSNAAPWSDPQSPPPPAALNQFIGAPAGQSWVLTIDKTIAPGVDFGKITDVLLGIEYTADVV